MENRKSELSEWMFDFDLWIETTLGLIENADDPFWGWEWRFRGTPSARVIRTPIENWMSAIHSLDSLVPEEL